MHKNFMIGIPMRLNHINNINFSSKFQLDANQEMPTRNDCILRDGLVGFWTSRSSNHREIHKQINNFFQKDYKMHKNKPLHIVLNIPDDSDENFKESMKMCGQKFDKIS